VPRQVEERVHFGNRHLLRLGGELDDRVPLPAPLLLGSGERLMEAEVLVRVDAAPVLEGLVEYLWPGTRRGFPPGRARGTAAGRARGLFEVNAVMRRSSTRRSPARSASSGSGSIRPGRKSPRILISSLCGSRALCVLHLAWLRELAPRCRRAAVAPHG
jgi:hypothetical protein